MSGIESKYYLGNIKFKKGKLVPNDPEMSVIVMSTNSDNRAIEAVGSVLNQSIKLEVIVVNTGRGSLQNILHPVLEKIILIETMQRQYAGGTRNIGIRSASAPIVAFLAADCIAASNWVNLRIKRHNEGYAAVASALEPFGTNCGAPTLASKCAHLYTHKNRIPEIPPAMAGLFGLSYKKSIFEKNGLFNEDVQVGEDDIFNEKLRNIQIPLWEREIITFHRYPDSFREAFFDQISRGRREMTYLKIKEDKSRIYIFLRGIKRNFNSFLWLLGNKNVVENRGKFTIFLGYLLTAPKSLGHLLPARKIY